jgi:hypothetical protein
MHTDEYEISLWRELTVCRTSIRKIESFLARMNKKYNIETVTFIRKYRAGQLARSRDFAVWAEKHEALEKWKSTLTQYEELFRTLKI